MRGTMVELFPTQTRLHGSRHRLQRRPGRRSAQRLAVGCRCSLVEYTHHEVAPAFYLIVCGVVAAFFSFSLIPLLHNKPLPAVAVGRSCAVRRLGVGRRINPGPREVEVPTFCATPRAVTQQAATRPTASLDHGTLMT